MKERIIEIVELGQPQSLIQRENSNITELIRTDCLIKELNEQLQLYVVVGQSEHFVCKCGLPKLKKSVGFSCVRTDCDMLIAN